MGFTVRCLAPFLSVLTMDSFIFSTGLKFVPVGGTDCPRGWDYLFHRVGRFVPWPGTNDTPPANSLLEPCKVEILERFVKADLHARRKLMYDVDNLLLQLRVDESFAILVAIVSAFTAEVSREGIAYLRTGYA